MSAKDIFVSTSGNDKNLGTQDSPFKSFKRAVNEAKKFAGKESLNIWFDEGTYYLNHTILLDNGFSGTANNPIIFSALPGSKVYIKGSKLLKHLVWNNYKKGIFVTTVPENLTFDQLFVNNIRQIRARFPNYDEKDPFRSGKGYLLVTGGTNKRYDKWFSFDPKTFTNKTWKHPQTGIVHAFQSHNWGNLQYRINSINKTENKIILGEGGWQIQRSHGIGGKDKNASQFFIENIFEELDTPGEWFLDNQTNKLYYYPKNNIDLANVSIEVPIIKDLIQLKGSSKSPIKYIQFIGLHFSQSRMTFMDKYEPLARGDWAIHRGGTIFMEGVENCIIKDCSFEYLGGNGIFMSSYNRNNHIQNCVFKHLGESAVCFVGSPSAVRLYQTWDDRYIYGKDWNKMRQNMDLTPGPKSPDYPDNCTVENCIMHDFGDIGKQVAGIFISMSHKIRASHNTIFNCPRAAICINDGTWGGHIIEFCDIWNTVRETGEHGPINAWGRDRQWLSGSGSSKDFIKKYTKLDAIDPTTIRNNRIANLHKSISAGNWTIDLDDGASNYEIYNNLNLGSTIKLRDGIDRKVFNNICVSAVPSGWHVWPEESNNEIFQNIFVISGAVQGKSEASKQFIRPIRLSKNQKWSKHYDNNLYWNVNYPRNPEMIANKSFIEWKKAGYDTHSEIANPKFMNPALGNYTVSKNSLALKLGFKNFPMNKFGHEMTRIFPFGGDFIKEQIVTLIKDKRLKNGGSIHYTIDGSEPTIDSPIYKGPFKINKTTCVKAISIDDKGRQAGFCNEVQFTKVQKIISPSWLSSLLEGKFVNNSTNNNKVKPKEVEIIGANILNIADDPDLIDASGGYNSGCYIKSIDKVKGKIWIDAGLDKNWIIQKVNSQKIANILDLQKSLTKFKGKIVIITASRNYSSETFQIKLP